MADVFLHEWEDRAHPPHDAAYAAARPLAVAALASFLASLVYRQAAALAVDFEDFRSVLWQANALCISSGCGTGAGRAQRLVQAVLAGEGVTHLGPAPGGPPTGALLSLSSAPDAELEMDELSEILQTLQTALGADVQIIFGHSTDDALPAATLHLWLLLGYPKS
ncbi:MAG: hypothetical protein ACRYFX_07615 [Janthinobacterium lividum]